MLSATCFSVDQIFNCPSTLFYLPIVKAILPFFFFFFFCCFADVHSLGHVQFFATPWTASQSFTISQSLLKFMSIKSVMPSNHLILSLPLLLLPCIFPSIRVFSNESVLHIRWAKYQSFSISPSNEYSGLISFRIDQFDLLAVQGTLKSLLQHHSSKLHTIVLRQ